MLVIVKYWNIQLSLWPMAAFKINQFLAVGQKEGRNRPRSQRRPARITAQINPAATVDWKGENGWVQIGATEIAAISANVSAHVQACFTNERTLATAIELLATVEDVIAYDIATQWAAV